MKSPTRRVGFAPVSGADAALAAYALTQAMLATFVDRGTLGADEAAALLRRASTALRRRSDDFEKAAAILDQEARFWSSATTLR